jgi:hypothetical protein
LLLVPRCSAAFVLLGTITSACATTEESTPAGETNANAGETQPAPSDTKAKPDKPKETSGQQNARESAEDYLSTGAFSRSGLIQQLKFEGFTSEQAEYGVKKAY